MPRTAGRRGRGRDRHPTVTPRPPTTAAPARPPSRAPPHGQCRRPLRTAHGSSARARGRLATSALHHRCQQGPKQHSTPPLAASKATMRLLYESATNSTPPSLVPVLSSSIAFQRFQTEGEDGGVGEGSSGVTSFCNIYIYTRV